MKRDTSNNWKVIEPTRNVTAHAQKPELVFLRNGRVHLNRRGGQFSRLLAVEECGSSGKTTGYPLHSHLSPSLTLPCVTVCRLIPIQLYWCATFGGHVRWLCCRYGLKGKQMRAIVAYFKYYSDIHQYPLRTCTDLT